MIQPKSGVGNTYVCVNMYYHADSLAASNTKHWEGVIGWLDAGRLETEFKFEIR